MVTTDLVGDAEIVDEWTELFGAERKVYNGLVFRVVEWFGTRSYKGF